MKITTSLVTRHRINDVEGLDPITVIAENFGPGSGKIIIECFGESWSHFWSHMGERYTLETFFIKASDDYIVGKLCQGRSNEPDWEGMPEILRKEIVSMRKNNEIDRGEARHLWVNAESVGDEFSAFINDEVMRAVLGGDWILSIPSRPTTEWNYLMKIVPAVRLAFTEIIAQKP